MTSLSLFSEVFLILGFLGGWIASERFHDYMMKERHHYEELFDSNPHPEIFNEEGEVYRGDYLAVTLDPNYVEEDDDWEEAGW